MLKQNKKGLKTKLDYKISTAVPAVFSVFIEDTNMALQVARHWNSIKYWKDLHLD